MANYCKIVKTEKDLLAGTELWVLTHECGKIEKRVARRRGDRHVRPAPIRVKCNQAGQESEGN